VDSYVAAFVPVCPDRRSDSFVGTARKEKWEAFVRQLGEEITTAEGNKRTPASAIDTCHTSGAMAI